MHRDLPIRAFGRLLGPDALLVAATMALAGCASLVRPSLDSYVRLERVQGEPADDSLEVIFLGVSTLYISDGKTALMIDGFATRPRLYQLILTRLDSSPGEVKAMLDLVDAGHSSRPPLRAVFVAHAHHDHVLDSAAVAAEAHATIHGSQSVLNVAATHTPSPAVQLLQDHDVIASGHFTVTAIETPHVPTQLFPGVIAPGFDPPARVWAYHPGENYSFHVRHPWGNILIIPSAGLPGNRFKCLSADVVFLGAGLIGVESSAYRQRYWQQTVGEVKPKWVIPIHWDDFTQPFGPGGLVAMPYVSDRFDLTMQTFEMEARQSGVKLRLMQAGDVFKLRGNKARNQTID